MWIYQRCLNNRQQHFTGRVDNNYKNGGGWEIAYAFFFIIDNRNASSTLREQPLSFIVALSIQQRHQA